MTVSDYQVFARRFRPTVFAEVVGQEVVTQTLANAVRGGRLAQAYLFAGPRGVGKTSVARILAKSLNCATGPTVTPCGVCDNCRSVAAGNDTDVLEIDGASNRSIDDVRELRQRVRFAPGHSPYKIYIIDEVHMLTAEAFNALLKTLEEPPDHVLFIFATTHLEKVPTTIVSRCQRFIFRRITTGAIEEKLARIAREEGLEAEPKALALIARRAGGSMRDAESLFDQVIAFAGERLTARDVELTLGLVAGEAVEALMAAVLAGDGAAALGAVDRLVREGADLAQAAHQAVEYLRDLLVLAAAPDAPELVDVGGEELDSLRRAAAGHSPAVLLNLINIFLEATGPMTRVFSPRLVLEYAALKAARVRSLLPVEELLAACEGAALPASAAATAPAGGGAAPARPHGAHAAAPAGDAAASITETWKKILETVARADRPLHALVAPARIIAMADGEIRLGFPPSHAASARKVDEERRRADLAALVAKAVGEPLTVRIEVEEAGAAGHTAEPQLFEDMPLVSEIQKRYGGEIVDEKETPAAGVDGK